ncbi:HEAT repeat domain-containing protein [Tumebacillus sp. ITR2]|uniref:HEAT repeat domain-containing protein n=1 Tax=Tumebacillus amylolyticus TaxID=2801339 RepID=A0ABS1JFP9_9BACL|nr:HEAT repeat domain-containing protein [Tumebacillus amylolyticus]MBL0389045.1 HEAT repeat domain-containing protein [Tumebacillus amylolyticus]
MINSALLWVLWAILGAIGLLLLLYLYLVVQKSFDVRWHSKLKLRRERLKPMVQKFLLEGEESRGLQHLNEADLVVLKDLLLEYNQVLRGVEQRERLQALAQLVFTEHFRRDMNSRNYANRLNALYAIEEFRMESLREDVVERLRRKRKMGTVERYQLYAILAGLQDDALLGFLTDSAQEPLPDFVYRELLLKMEDSLFNRLFNQIYTLPTALRYCLIDIIGNKGDYSYLTAIEELTYSRSVEERIRALKAITKFGYVKRGSTLVDKSEAETWQERLMASRAMGAVAKDEFVDVLKKMLRDSSWWVRKESAQSLLRYPRGQEILRQIAESDEDRYARDMAREWLEAKQI